MTFPVDDATLDLLWQAIHTDAERSSVGDLLGLYSELNGSDMQAVEEEIEPGLFLMRDSSYHPNDVISALIDEVRRLRAPERAT